VGKKRAIIRAWCQKVMREKAMRAIWAIIISSSLVFFSQEAPAAQDTYHTLTLHWQTRSYWVHLPRNMPSEGNLPVIIALHGGASDGETTARYSGLNGKSDQAGFMAVYPNGTGPQERILTWNAGNCCAYARRNNIDDVAFIESVIKDLEKKYRIDRSRVYLTGIFNGAMMAYRIAAEAPHLLVAVAAVAGSLEIPATRIKKPIPILHFHGTEDEYLPFVGGRGPKTAPDNSHNSVENTIQAWVKINQAEPTPQIEELPDKTKDGTRVVRYTYAARKDGAEVILYKIIGGGHTWPGRPFREKLLGKATMNIDANDIL
jgi:polyhydroxybutyrate depolymerase